MIRLKDGSVSLVALCPQIVLALNVADSIFSQRGLDTVVTSANDGRHSRTSLHYDGKAVDIRSRHLAGAVDARRVTGDIKGALGQDFDVVLESIDQDNEHIHIEWQPKRRPSS